MLNFKNPQKIIAPPPTLYISVFSILSIVNYFFPSQILPNNFSRGWIVAIIAILSIALVASAFLTMRHAKTSPNPFGTPDFLVTAGPFRYSRNPIYLAMMGIYLSGALACNSLWNLSGLVILFFLMNWGVIEREEKYLTELFGDAYKNYAAKVRRWI